MTKEEQKELYQARAEWAEEHKRALEAEADVTRLKKELRAARHDLQYAISAKLHQSVVDRLRQFEVTSALLRAQLSLYEREHAKEFRPLDCQCSYCRTARSLLKPAALAEIRKGGHDLVVKEKGGINE